MKKIIAIMILAGLSSSVFAAAVCDGTTAKPGAVQTATPGTTFNLVTFTPKCSANVFMDEAQTTVNVGVGAGSAKGKNVFAGNSGGGSVAPNGTACGSSGCTQPQTATAATAALAAAAGT